MKKMIPDCYWPSSRNGSYVSHEAICLLNTHEQAVEVRLTLYFEDRPKLTGFHVEIEAERTTHIRMDKLRNDAGETVPQDTPYAALVECDVELPVQYTRVDTTQPELALMTTVI